MDIRDLKCFQEVYKKKSINSAAKNLYITAQGLGKIISSLEHELDIKLFKRSVKGLEPTPSGNILFEKSQLLIDEFETIINAIEQEKNREKQIKIFCSRGVLSALSFDVISLFIKNNKNVEVYWKETSNENAKKAVENYTCDIAIVIGKNEVEDIETKLLQKRKLCVLVYKGHKYFDRDNISIKDLDGENIITLNEQYQVYHEFNKAANAYDIKPNIKGLTEDIYFLYKLCTEKQGLGIVLDFSVDEFKLEDVKLLPIIENLTWDIYLMYRKDNKFSISDIEIK